jgi:hypothetical protein
MSFMTPFTNGRTSERDPPVEHVGVRERDPVDVVRPGGRRCHHDRGPHRLPERDDGPCAEAELVEAEDGLVHPLGPPPRSKVLEIGPVAGQPDALDGESCSASHR